MLTFVLFILECSNQIQILHMQREVNMILEPIMTEETRFNVDCSRLFLVNISTQHS